MEMSSGGTLTVHNESKMTGKNARRTLSIVLAPESTMDLPTFFILSIKLMLELLSSLS